MARVRTAFLCNFATQETSGLVSAIGAFADTVYNAALPIHHVFFLVARIETDQDELDRPLELSLRLARDDDASMILDAHGTMHAAVMPGADPSAPALGQIIMPIPAMFEREGSHTLELRIDDAVVWTAPVRAVLLDSAPQ